MTSNLTLIQQSGILAGDSRLAKERIVVDINISTVQNLGLC